MSHDPSEFILLIGSAAQKTFHITIIIIFIINNNNNNITLFLIEIFCNIINVFAASFEQFNILDE